MPSLLLRTVAMLVTGLVLGMFVWRPSMAEAQSKKPAAGSRSRRFEDTNELFPKKAAKDRKGKEPQIEGIAVYKSRNFVVHTDLNQEAAEDLLQRLEAMLVLVARYYRKPLSGIIDMYVVSDYRKWPDGVVPAEALRNVENGGGLTVAQTLSDGNRFLSRAVVYASASRGTPQHEAVHAYCVHTFGRVGPTWYAEGMAEMGQYWQANDTSVNAHDDVIRYLRGSEPKSLAEIVDGRDLSGDSWQNYAWRWALCHLLANNANYADRFQPLGIGLLTGQQVSFERTYGEMAPELTFEFEWFIEHLTRRLRVDLCSWDWRSKFKPVATSAVTTCKIAAGRGWQASRLTLVQGSEYEFAAAGEWATDAGGPLLSAQGAADGRGRLEGVLLTTSGRAYQLSETIDLGAHGSFTAPARGDLFLRCRDDWAGIADNRGTVTVRLKLKGKGPPLANPGSNSPETIRATAEDPRAP